MTHVLTRITDVSPETLTRLVDSYARSFDAREFYPVRVQFAGLPEDEVERWHRLGIAQKVWRSLHNPGHEVWCVRASTQAAGGEEEGRERGSAEMGEGGIAAVMILRHPNCPRDGPSPYDAELDGMPAQAKERHGIVRARSDALKTAAGEGYHLSWLGTVPEHRGEGMGGALVRMALERAREDGALLRLSTNSAENVEYYKRFGFVVAGYDEWDMGGTQFTWWVMVAYP